MGSLTVAGRLALVRADGLAQHAVGDFIEERQLRTGLFQRVEEAGRLLLGDGQRRLNAEHARVGSRHLRIDAVLLQQRLHHVKPWDRVDQPIEVGHLESGQPGGVHAFEVLHDPPR